MTNEEAKEILEEVKILDDSMYQYNKTYLQALDMAIKALEQEPKTGHWIYNDNTLEYKCSECGRPVDTRRFERPYIRYPYCHCGAKMVEPQESEVK